MAKKSSNSIATFKENFNGGNRPNRFEVDMSSAFPTEIQVLVPNKNEKFKIYATSLPSAELGTIQVPYRGRLLNFAGDRNYSAWTIGIYDDNNTDNLWRTFQHWKERIDGHVSHQVGGGEAINDFGYTKLQTTWTIKQLSLNGDSSIRTITLFNCWPEQITALNLDMNSADFSRFTVNLVFDYYQITQGLETD